MPEHGDQPAIAVVVPTRNRADYLGVTLESILSQRLGRSYEVLVVDDGSDDATAGLVDRLGVDLERHERPRGPNAARNTGIAATTAPLVALVDDDVRAPQGWLSALVAGAERHRWADALGGPIRAALEGPAPRSCGRESAPITTLDLGPQDRETEFVWSANMVVRRAAVQRVGGFDEEVPIYGDEEEWLMRLHADGGRVAYVADAVIEHRRAGDDARLRALARAEYRRGRAARRNDIRKGTAPPLGTELRYLAGAGWHTARRRCPQGLVMGAHCAGRLLETVRGS
jgi:glycosyltransferase involved in cell wall biosynthesis